MHALTKIGLLYYSMTIRAGLETILRLDTNRRMNIMRNNTLSCLTLFTLRKMFPLLYLQYDNCDENHVNLRLCVHGPELNLRGSPACAIFHYLHLRN